MGNQYLVDDLVSIIMPVYNAERFLAETIRSVQRQTYENLENRNDYRITKDVKTSADNL